MDLYEYQGKQFFARFGIPVSPGEAVTTVDDAVAAAEKIGYPVVVKAQVQVGGRGKAGGIKLADTADDVRLHAGNILGMDIKGHTVETLWIELASDIAEEYYASFTLDRSAKKHLGMLSAEGGVEIETVAEENPDAIAKIHVDPVDGLTEAQCREWVAAAKLNPAATEGAVDILLKLYTAYTEGDADLCEINPLILKPTGEVHALDAKVTLDANATFRHDEWEEYEATQVLDERERMAREIGDLETARGAGAYGARHRERAGVLERKLEALEAERTLCRRDLDEMERALQDGRVAPPPGARGIPDPEDLDRHPAEGEFRNLEDAGRDRAAAERLEELKRRMGRS